VQSAKHPEDYLQVGYSFSDDYQLENYSTTGRKNQGIGVPINYGNATLAGSKSVGHLRCTAFGWLAWDQYDVHRELKINTLENYENEQVYLPWGMGSVKFNNDSSNRSFTIGGSRQFFGTGKQFYSKVITTRSYLNNGELSFDSRRRPSAAARP
jgi:hypothetical protein